MDPIIPFDFQRMFIGQQPFAYYGEIMVRVLLLYGFAVLCLRLLGKRLNHQMSPLEQVVIITLGSASGDVMLYPDVPLFYAFMVIFVVTVLTGLSARLQAKYNTVAEYLSGTPDILIQNGRIDWDMVRKKNIAEQELYSMLRERGVQNITDIQLGVQELSGSISVYTKEKPLAEHSVLMKVA